MQELEPYPEVLAVAADFLSQEAQLVERCIQVQQIPAPTFAEGDRAQWVADELRRLGLQDVRQGAEFNVYGCVPGRRSGRGVVVSAHTDTVFPAETDLTVYNDATGGRVFGPGIGDNSAGVAGLLLLAEKLCTLPAPPVDIWLVANSGEEGLGDLRGMRAAVDELGEHIGACIVVEGMGLGRVVHRALGSRRYRVTAQAPGGHSWSDFGMASAIHALVQLASDLARMRVAAHPRTTFNIGRFSGGTSINTIAQQADLELDLRSESNEALEALVHQMHNVIRRYQTPRWRQAGVTVAAEMIGDRPSGSIPADHVLVRAAVRALAAANVPGAADLRISSTDANIPLSRGIPAVCVGITEGGNAHRLEEWLAPTLLPRGMQHLLLLTWWAAMWLGGEAV